MIRSLTLIAFTAASLGVAPLAVAQERNGTAITPHDLGVTATSPSRMDRSRREMNRGRATQWRVNMTPSQIRSYAESTLAYAGFVCEVSDAIVVGQTTDGVPLAEVDCADGGGLLIADTQPVMATDCLDLGAEGGIAVREGPRVAECRLPGNVASVAAERESERRQAAARN